MFQFSRNVLALLLLGAAWRVEAAEMIITPNRLAYPAKEYGPSSPTIEAVGGNDSSNRQAAAGYPCADTRTHSGCPLALGEVHYRDHLTGLVSLLMPSAEPGLGWYGTVGAWRWATLELRSSAKATCSYRADCGFALNDFEVRQRTVLYAGGGIQYRFDWKHFSVTPSFGVVGHWPRIESVTGSKHLFQSGVRIGFKVSERSAVIVGYAHFSNGKGLGLADRGSPNQGIEQLGLGISYRF